MQTGHASEAATLLRSYLTTYPDSAQAAYLLGYTLYSLHQPRESLAQYTRAAALRAPSPEDLFAVSADYILLSDYADANKWLAAVTAAQPGNALAWYYQGRCLFELERYPEASAALTHALTLQPRYIRAEIAKGLVDEALDHPDEALACYRRAQGWDEASSTHDAQPYLSAGELLLKQGQLSEARDALLKAEAISQSNPRIFEDLGRLDLRLNHYSEAEEELHHAEVLAPSSSSLHFLRGTALQHLGKVTEAEAEFAATKRLVGTQSNHETENFDLHP